MSEINELPEHFKQINRETLVGWVGFFWENGELVRYNSEEHNWADLPKVGCQGLYRDYGNYKEQVGGCDFYCPYQLFEAEDVNPWIKFGLYIDDTTYNEEIWPVIFSDIMNK